MGLYRSNGTRQFWTISVPKGGWGRNLHGNWELRKYHPADLTQLRKYH